MDLSLTFKHLEKLENVDFHIDDIQIKNFENKGVHLYKRDDIFRDIATFMEHPESYNFYKKYFTCPEYTKFILISLKIYDIISKILERHNMEFNAYHKIYILYILVNHPTYSRIIFRDEKKYHSIKGKIQ